MDTLEPRRLNEILDGTIKLTPHDQPDLDRHLALFLEQATERLVEISGLKKQLERDPHIPEDRFMRRDDARVRERIRVLQHGASPLTRGGERVVGLNELEAIINKLRSLREGIVSRPVLTFPAPYRLTRGKHRQDELNVLPGEIVMLDEAQAEAWADKFERVELEETVRAEG